MSSAPPAPPIVIFIPVVEFDVEFVCENTLLDVAKGENPMAAVNNPAKITKPNEFLVFIGHYRSAKYKSIFYIIIIEKKYKPFIYRV